jgi:hypothetical protein
MRNKIFKRYNHIIDESNKIIFLFLVLNLLGVNTLQNSKRRVQIQKFNAYKPE